MTIITISRGTFAGGEQLAKMLAPMLGYRTVSRELLYQTVETRHGITAAEASEMAEQAPRHCGPEMADRDTRQSVGAARRLLFVTMQSALCELLQEDGVIYHGNAGHLLLPGVSHVLRVRIVAPRGMRIEMAMQREGLTRTAASRKIDQVDGERARWTQAFFDARWGDPLLFDIVFNLEQLSVDEAAATVVQATKLNRFQATPESRQKLADLWLASRVAAALHAEPKLATLSVEVSAASGVVKLLGVGANRCEAAVALAGRVEGVKAVQLGS
jgi:cytidylate kinase